MDFEITRRENDERLLLKLDSIRSCSDINTLAPFAKAYLGMFYVIDNKLAAEEKITLLCNQELAEAVLFGFRAALRTLTLPTVQQVACLMVQQKEFNEGYVMLAAMDIFAKESWLKINLLPQNIIETTIAFHYANKTGNTNIWFDNVVNNMPDIAANAFCELWTELAKNNASFLPGSDYIFSHKPHLAITKKCVLPLLINWRNVKHKKLFKLINIALCHADIDELFQICEQRLTEDEKLNEKVRLYWYITAFLIKPDLLLAGLSNYVGRTKLKIMPMLDFIINVLMIQKTFKISNIIIAQLLKMIAPVFPPQQHVYGALGALDINSRHVLMLFYILAISDNTDVMQAIKILRKARVLKIYSGVLDSIDELQQQKIKNKKCVHPTFDEYIISLMDKNRLQGRSNRFDLR